MSPFQGPGPRYQALASNDVDQHASHLSCWQQQYDQLSQGRFAGSVRELWADAGPRLQVFHEHTHQQTSQQCQPWRGAVWFGIPDGRPHEALHFCGRLQAARPVLRAGEDTSFTLRTPADFGIYGVVVDADWLAHRLDQLAVHDSRACGGALQAVQAVQVAPAVHRAICRTIESMLHLGATGDAAQPGARVVLQGLLDQLLKLLCGQGAHSTEDGQPADTAASRRLATVMLARELVSRPMNHATTVDEVCAELHLTRRTLQNHFHSVVGDSPADFLKAVRMNACRRKLREGGATVQDVAAQWGFFHMGHFSHDYKQMFGELPSQTLRGAAMLSARSARGSSRSRPARHRPAAGLAASSGPRPAAAPATAG